MDSHRQRAIGRNEAMFRELNELVNDSAALGRTDGELIFLCECGDESCADEVPLTQAEYETVRAIPTHFLVRPGHFQSDAELVLTQHDRYWIVEKTGDAAEVARDTDPRP